MHTVLLLGALGASVAVPVSPSDSTTQVMVRLNGHSRTVYELERPNESGNVRSWITSTRDECFPVLADRGDTGATRPLLSLTMEAAAEVGENALARAAGDIDVNRDHATRIGMVSRVARLPLWFAYGYRYVDTYSDRFDSLWTAYRAIDGRSVAHADKGVAHEHAVRWRADVHEVEAVDGSVHFYNCWGTTPYYFTPLLTRGIRARQRVLVPLGVGVLGGLYEADVHDDFYDPSRGHRRTDHRWDLVWLRPLGSIALAEASVEGNTRETPWLRSALSIRDTVLDPFGWEIDSRLHGDLRVDGGAGIGIRPHGNVTVLADGAWRRLERQRDFTFYEGGVAVDYINGNHEQLRAHCGVSYEDTLKFPLGVTAWFDYCDRPLWERVETSSTRRRIRQDTIMGSAQSTIGAAAFYDIRTERFGTKLSLAGAAAIDGGVMPAELPGLACLQLTGGDRDTGAVFLEVDIEHRSRFVLRYLRGNTGDLVESLTAPAQTRLSFTLVLPFLSPVWRERLSARLVVTGGPFHLGRSNMFLHRAREHPGGNLIGPALSLRVDASLLSP